MGVLHLIGCSPEDGGALARCLARVGEGDAVLLLADAVYAAFGEGASLGIPGTLCDRAAVYVLLPDLVQRGLETLTLPAGVQPVDYSRFVALTTIHNPIVSWF